MREYDVRLNFSYHDWIALCATLSIFILATIGIVSIIFFVIGKLP